MSATQNTNNQGVSGTSGASNSAINTVGANPSTTAASTSAATTLSTNNLRDESFITKLNFALFGESGLDQYVGRSKCLAEVISAERLARKAAFANLCHADLDIALPGHIISTAAQWHDNIKRVVTMQGAVVQRLAARPNVQLNINRAYASWSNTVPSGSVLKLRTAYEAEHHGFDAGYHRGMRRDEHQADLAVLRSLEQATNHYVSWFVEGQCRFLADRLAARAFDAGELNWDNGARGAAIGGGTNYPRGLDTLDLRPTAALMAGASRPRHLAVYPEGLMFQYPSADYSSPVASAAVVTHTVEEYAADAAAGLPAIPERDPGAALPEVRLLIVPVEAVSRLYHGGAVQPWSSNVYVSRARGQGLLRDIVAAYEGYHHAFLREQEGLIILVAPNMMATTVRSVLESVGFRAWRMGLAFSLCEFAPYLLWGEHNRNFDLGESDYEIYPEDAEAILYLETCRRFTLAVGAANVHPLSYGLEVSSRHTMILSQWMQRVAAAMGYLAAERCLVPVPRYNQMAGACAAYGIELARWCDLTISRVAGSWANLRATPGLLSLRKIATLATAAWAFTQQPGGLMPLIPTLRLTTGLGAPVYGNVLTCGSRRDWGFSLNLPYKAIWDSGDVSLLPEHLPGAPDKFDLAKAGHDALRNVLLRGELLNAGNVTLYGTRGGLAEATPLRWNAGYAGPIPHELLTGLASIIVARGSRAAMSEGFEIALLSHTDMIADIPDHSVLYF